MTRDELNKVGNDQLDTDYEISKRKIKGKTRFVVTIFSIIFSLYHFYTVGFAPLMGFKHRTIHIAGILAFIFLFYPAKKNSPKDKPSYWDWFLCIITLLLGIYTFLQIDIIGARGGTYTQLNVYMGAIMILLILEATRRAIGYNLVVIPLIFIVYALMGIHLPGILMHSGFSLRRIILHLYITTEGIMGITTGVSADYVFLFVLFGTFLAKGGMTEFFNELSIALAGRQRGGPAKVAVIASAMVGTVTGSAAANVVTTGAFTIPLMKKIGYPSYFAGAVEAAASTAGQITPPVMGAATFIMAEFLGIPYLRVIIAAIVPAFLYYVCVWSTIDFRASKLGLKGLKKNEIPDLKKLIIDKGHLIIPLVSIIIFLVMGYSPMYAVTRALIIIIGVSWLKKSTSLGFSKILDALSEGAQTVLPVCMACIVVGIVVGVVSLTGLGTRLGMGILSIAGGNLFLTLMMTMIVCIILGMGLPTSAAYIITATITVHAIVKLGVPALAAHMFVFYYAMLSGLTPPVAVTAYIAAGMAKADSTKTALASLKLAAAGFIVPFMFIYSQVLLLSQGSFFDKIITIATSMGGVILLAASIEGYLFNKLSLWKRAMLFVSSIGLIYPEKITDLLFSILMIIFIIFEFYLNRKKYFFERSQDENLG